ncbi:glycosyltransferase [Candidatus Woesearchaeota archaeon]|nr:glycosyltransferase [Candidatus Woesearchaeota archaeon]
MKTIRKKATRKRAKIYSEKVSACVIIKDEEKLLPGLLENIKDVCDEFVVIHDGPCKDDSLKITMKYTNKVYVRPWIGQAEPHRPFAFKMCKGDWILWIDADERLTPKIKAIIPQLVKREEVGIYSFLQPLFCGTKRMTRGWWGNQFRDCVLFRKSYIEPYSGLPSGTLKLKKGKIVRIPLAIEHFPPTEKNTWKAIKSGGVRTANAFARVYYLRDFKKYPKAFYYLKAFLWFGGYLFYFLFWKRSIFYGKENIQASFFGAVYYFIIWWTVARYKPNPSDNFTFE